MSVDLINRLLELDPEAEVVGGNVKVYRDGVHTIYGGTFGQPDSITNGIPVFALTDAGKALVDAADAIKTKRPKKNSDLDSVLAE